MSAGGRADSLGAQALMARLLRAGADGAGIADRFLGNDELYKRCFVEFLDEPSFDALQSALARGDCEGAFDAAHALKGLSGNLGLTAFYADICALVESLRAGDMTHTKAQYDRVEAQRRALEALCGEDMPAQDAQKASDQPPPGAAAPRAKRKKPDCFVLLSLAILTALFVLVGIGLSSILRDYEANVARESADHLKQINEQIKLYVEEALRGSRRAARALCESLSTASPQTDEGVLSFIQRQQDVLQAGDVVLYTKNGLAVGADGVFLQYASVGSAAEKAAPGALPDIVAEALQSGHAMRVSESRIVFAVPADTPVTYGGSAVVAAAVARQMNTFLDDMAIMPFGGEATLLLYRQDGEIISRLSNAAHVRADRFGALLESKRVSLIEGEDEGTLGMSVRITADGQSEDYLVQTRIDTGEAPIYLAYIAPVSVVNAVMNRFSQRLQSLCLFVMLALTAVSLMVFIARYRTKKRAFDKELSSRDVLLELMTKSTQTALCLIELNQSRPAFVTENAAQITGEAFFCLFLQDGAYRVLGASGEQNQSVARINEVMRAWDGQSEFRSGYIRRPGGEPPSYYSLQLYPAGGNGTRFVGIIQDATGIFNRESAAKTALEMAEHANKAKSRFLSNMSHDIRTPLNAIINMSRFAQDCMADPKRLAECLQTIVKSSDHLLELVNNVLDMNAIENGQTVVQSRPFCPLAEVRRAAGVASGLCAARMQTFIADIDGLSDAAVLGDGTKFSQVVMNLVSNAVKYTPEKGAVRLTALNIPPLRSDMTGIRVTVEDNGIGISQDNIKRIFEPFARVDDKRVGRAEGTGLGLSICQSYVDAMGGTIACQSEEGEGSIFTVELFFENADGAPAPAPAPGGDAPFLGRHCLIAEDNPTNRRITVLLLEHLGFLTDTADNGQECVQRFLASAPGTYDCIYMDIQMPLMDGYEAAVAIRESAHPQAKTVPIIAMTANVFPEDVEKARIAGMNGHLGKPVLSAQLIEETAHLLGARGSDT